MIDWKEYENQKKLLQEKKINSPQIYEKEIKKILKELEK